MPTEGVSRTGVTGGGNAGSGNTARELRVFLVDDHSVFRSGVRAELSQADGITVVGGAGTVADSVAGIRETRPDVVLLDVHMPGGGGLAVLQETVRELGSQAPVFLALSVSDSAEDVIAVVRAGARGYVTKTISGTELASAIRRVASGDAFFSPRLAGFVLDAFCRPDPSIRTPGVVADSPEPAATLAGNSGTAGTGQKENGAGLAGLAGPGSEAVPAAHAQAASDPVVDALTRRELEVLKLLARGYTYKEIGAELFISVKTVESHASNILRKTQMSNRYALTRWATERALD